MNESRASRNLADSPAAMAQETAKTVNSLQVRAPALPLPLAAQLFSAFSPKDLAQEDVAATLLRLARPVQGQAKDAALDVVTTAADLAGRGRLAQAEALLRQALSQALLRKGPEAPRVWTLQLALGDVLTAQGELAEARRLLVKTVEVQREILGTQAPATLTTLEKLALLLIAQGELRYAEPLLCEAVLVRRAQQGDAHVDTLRALSALALLLLRQGKPAEAEPLLQQCLRAQRKLLGAGHQDSRDTLARLAAVVEALGNVADAEAYLQRAVVLSRQALGTYNVQTLQATYQLADFLLRVRRAPEARYLLRDLLPLVRRTCSRRTQLYVDVEARLGASLRRMGDFARAERHLNDSFERSREHLGMAHVSTQYALGELIALYDAWGKPQEAAPFRQAHDACS